MFEKAELEREKQARAFSCSLYSAAIPQHVIPKQELEEEGLGAFTQLQEQMNALLQQVLAVDDVFGLWLASLTPPFQASAKMATLKGENDTLKAHIAQLLQPSPPAAPASTTSGSAVNDAEPDDLNDLNDSHEAASECTGTAGGDSRRSSCVSTLETSRGSLIDRSSAASPHESVCDDGSGDASMLSALDCSSDELAISSVMACAENASATASTGVVASPHCPPAEPLLQAAGGSPVAVSNAASCGVTADVDAADDEVNERDSAPNTLHVVRAAPVDDSSDDFGGD